MRLDVFLKSVGLFRQRSEARSACAEGRVVVGERPAKAAHPVRVGDRICVTDRDCRVEAEVIEIPARPPSRAERGRYCRVLSQEQARQSDADLSF
jgi:ribosomal 50S subunit-recycling heat shock protein